MLTRQNALTAVIILVAGFFVWRLFFVHDGVTLDFDNAPASKVVKSLERQTGIRMVTNADLSKPMSIHIRKAPTFEAINTVAIRLGGDARLAYIAAPDSRKITEAIVAYQTGGNPGGWTAFTGFGGGGPRGPQADGGQPGGQPAAQPPADAQPAAPGAQPGGNPPDGASQTAGNRRPRSNLNGGSQNDTAGAQPGGGNPGGRGPGGGGGGNFGGGFGGFGALTDGLIDPRLVLWKFSVEEDKSLQSALYQGSVKTGALFAFPADWNPVVTGLPSSARVTDMARAIAKASRGKVEEVFLVYVRPDAPVGGDEEGAPRGRGPVTIFSPGSVGPARPFHPEWMTERSENQIALLPPDQKAQVLKDMEEMRALRESLRNLTEEERRAKMEEYFNRSDVQDRMDERMSQRESQSSPQQREARFRRYVERREAAKSANNTGGSTQGTR
ncbi:MAG: hypothetical protein BGO12_18695 [Verrucomicrobia bacterium 61-8]|nr:hypothetical protein [Verrucomicrobiota bacterium]OJV17406.1 MAG: hypothetical protein BGO12_18695 [Verrucomicrobia bacterium 61-8]